MRNTRGARNVRYERALIAEGNATTPRGADWAEGQGREELMAARPHDPRSDAEKARADLKRNAEMDMAVTESPLVRLPSVTPASFGVHDETARLRSGAIEGVEGGGAGPEPGSAESPSIAEVPQVAAGRDRTAPARRVKE